MASEYLKWKYRDVKPREQVELTPAEKRKNWWYYHKWHILIGVVLAAVLASLIWQMLGIGRVYPDYQFAYVGTTALPEEAVAALEAGLASLGEDLNGDGSTVVTIRQYSVYSTDPTTVIAAQTQLMSDLSECESFFFLLDDPEQFQLNYHSLARVDGSLPAEGDASAEGTYLLWSQCPALAGLDLGRYSYSVPGEEISGDCNELVADLAVARRGFWTDKTVSYPEGCEALWAAMTEGAAS